MPETHLYSSDVAFTPAVKAIQERKGSREAYAHVEARGGWRTEIDENLAAFLADANSFYFATASADGQPYIQHRGGPKGFIKTLDKNTLAFADYSGNQQYITQGKSIRKPQGLYLRDGLCPSPKGEAMGRSADRRRRPCASKIADAQGYRARPEQVIVFRLAAWDTNCPQHIPQKFDAADVAAALASRDARIAELEAELAALKAE